MDADPRGRLEQLRIDAEKKFNRRQRKSTRWKQLNYWLGGLSAVLAAVAGFAIVGEWLGTDVAGGLALVSALLTALVAFYDFEGRALRVGVERAEWRRFLQDVLSLCSSLDQLPSEAERRGAVDALWHRFCDLEKADALARARSR